MIGLPSAGRGYLTRWSIVVSEHTWRALKGLARPGGSGHVPLHHGTEVFVGWDVAKVRHAVAIAESSRDGEVRLLGEIDADTERTYGLTQ